MPHATLAIIEGREAGREFAVTGTTLLGRDPGADVVVADSDVSPQHASFVVVDGGIAVEDLGSSRGTFVNGERVTGSRRLEPGDRIRVGATVLEVRPGTPADRQRQATQVTDAPRAPVAAAPTRQASRAVQIPTAP